MQRTKPNGLQLIVLRPIVFIGFLLLIGYIMITTAAIATGGGNAAYLPFLAQNYNSAWHWNSPITTTLTPAPFNPPATIIDPAGRFHIFWDTLSSPRYIYHTYWDGQKWSGIIPVGQSLGISSSIKPPFISSDGKLHLVWRSDFGVGTPNRFRLLYASFDGAAWSSVQEIYQTDAYYIQGLVHTDEADHLHALIQRSYGVSASIFEITRTLSALSAPLQIDPGHLVDEAWADRSGGIHIFGQIAYPEQLFYSYWKEGQFQVVGRQGTGYIGVYPTQMDEMGNLHLFYTANLPVPGGVVRGVIHQCVNTNLNWWERETPSGEADVTGPLMSGWDQNNRLGLAWKETNSGNIQLGVWNGCVKTNFASITFPQGKNWEVSSLAISSLPNKICALVKEMFTSLYTVRCVEIEN